MKLDLLYEIDAPRPWDGGTAPVRASGRASSGRTARCSTR